MFNHRIITMTKVARVLKEGQIGVIPTDTVYGVVALATNREAVTRLYNLKSREQKPGTIIAASVQQLHDLGITQADLDTVSKW